MKTIGLLYSKSTAYTAELGERIAAAWGKGIEYVDINTAHLADVEKHAALILGTPTYFNGELPSAWDEFLPEIEDADFSGKPVAIYGPGNQVEFPVSFADGVGILARYFQKLGAKVVGCTSCEGYEYEYSLAECGCDKLLGLIVDPTNQPELTDARLTAWIKQVKKEFGVK